VSSIKKVPAPSAPPSKLAMLGEIRALVNIASMPISLGESVFTKSEGEDCLPIILFPGFASDERYMKPLERYLKNLAYEVEGWGLGLNLAGSDLDHTLEDISDAWDIEPYDGYNPNDYKGEAGVPYLADKAVERVRQRAEELGGRVILIGWSLGGYLAREVARDLPDIVSHVITLGAPIIGGPKYTTAAQFFKLKGFNLDWIESESSKRDRKPIQQPITAIYSKSDAVVDWRAAVDKISPNVSHIEIKSSHLGMGFNRKVWLLIRKQLQLRLMGRLCRDETRP